VDDEVSGRRV